MSDTQDQKPPVYMWFRNNVAFKFTFFYHDPWKARMLITAAQKDGVEGKVIDNTAINIALNAEEAAEFADGMLYKNKLSIVLDSAKFNKNNKQMKSLNCDEFSGKYWISLKYDDDTKRTIQPSLREALVLKRLVDVFIERIYFTC